MFIAVSVSHLALCRSAMFSALHGFRFSRETRNTQLPFYSTPHGTPTERVRIALTAINIALLRSEESDFCKTLFSVSDML